jgi:predicted O-methyltransferase YrrM
MRRFKKSVYFLVTLLFIVYFVSIIYTPKLVHIDKYDFSEVHAGLSRNNNDLIYGMKAFNGAPEIAALINYFKKKYELNTAVETGTFIGSTAAFLASTFNKVHTIEIVEKNLNRAKENLKDYRNIRFYLGSSPEILASLVEKLQKKNVLFYLDAHWQEYWPILDELKIISKVYNKNTVILIDDIKVPGRFDIDYDKYDSKELSLKYIKSTLDENFKDYKVQYILPKFNESRAKLVITFS